MNRRRFTQLVAATLPLFVAGNFKPKGKRTRVVENIDFDPSEYQVLSPIVDAISQDVN